MSRELELNFWAKYSALYAVEDSLIQKREDWGFALVKYTCSAAGNL